MLTAWTEILCETLEPGLCTEAEEVLDVAKSSTAC